MVLSVSSTLEDVPHQNSIFFKHDSASALFNQEARDCLDFKFLNRRNRWSAKLPSQRKPPNSPELNPVDFVFWIHLKSLV